MKPYRLRRTIVIFDLLFGGKAMRAWKGRMKLAINSDEFRLSGRTFNALFTDFLRENIDTMPDFTRKV